MSDLISRADAIEAIQNAYCKPCKERGDDYNEVRCRACEYDNAIIQIDALPSAEAGWIPCSKRLPSEGEVVLAAWSCLWKGAIVLARRYEGKWEWAYEYGADYWQPTELEEHWPEVWMPLPKPYREDGDE